MRDGKSAVLVVRDWDCGLREQEEEKEEVERGGGNERVKKNMKEEKEEKGKRKEENRNQIIGYARWGLPILDEREKKTYVEPPWCLPEGTQWGVLNTWTAMVEGAQERVLKGEACYRKFFFFFIFLFWLRLRAGVWDLGKPFRMVWGWGFSFSISCFVLLFEFCVDIPPKGGSFWGGVKMKDSSQRAYPDDFN